MARNRDPFSSALAAVRERIKSGALRGGAPVIVADEAERLKLSTTPVREALAHLSGEGLVARTGSRGYMTVRLDRSAAQDQYTLRSLLIRGALEQGLEGLEGLIRPRPMLDPEAPTTSVQTFFGGIVRGAGNELLSQAYDRLVVQGEPLVRAEKALFADLGREAAELFAAYEAGRPDRFAVAVAAYYRRRLEAAAALAALAGEAASEPHEGPD